jgi:ABC-type transport system substrate-binding protein
MRRSASRPWLLAMIAVLTIVAAACSSDDAPDAAPAGGDETATTLGAHGSTVTIDPSGEPQRGGSLVFGLEGDNTGWNPTVDTWAISGHTVALAVFDPLAAYDADGVPQPYLAESFEHSADFTTWTIHLRPGVQFHDGTPCDAAAVAKALNAYREAFLTMSVYSSVTDVSTPDDLTVVLTMDAPWASFPAILATQAGYVPAPAQLDAEGEASKIPIGTGPFQYESWAPGGDFVAVRNDHYWQEGLPYLDEVTFRPIIDPVSRENSLLTGDIDMTQTSDADSIVRLRDEAATGHVQIMEDPGEQEEQSILLNNSAPPFNDERARKALVLATDVDAYLQITGGGITPAADGPFVPTSPWYSKPDYPAFDADAARALVADYEADNGPLSFSLAGFNDSKTTESMQALEAMYESVGMDVELESVEQQALGVKAISGDFEALSWRQFSAPDPDGDYVWWHTGSDDPQVVNLDFARIDDPQVDEALDEARATDDVDVRKAAYADLQQRFADLLPYVWLAHTTWSVAAGPDVRGLSNGPLPDGSPSMPFGGQLSGYARLTTTWMAS